MLNQRGDHTHLLKKYTLKIQQAMIGKTSIIGDRFLFPLSELGYNAASDTEYLRNDKIHFKLWMKMQ